MASVRPATLDDADAIGAVHVRAWQAAYRGVLPDALLDGLDAEQRAQVWRDRLRSASPGHELLVAVDGPAVVGFAFVGTADGGRAATLGQLYAINLVPEAWGTGTGELLLRRAEQQLVGHGHGRAVLWVAEGNDRARRFYERHGWRPTGRKRAEQIGEAVVPELEYARELS